MATATRADVRRQQQIDRKWPEWDAVLEARIAAVAGAADALARRETAAVYALRQALVDLAAIAELVADDLPRPREP